MKLYTTLLIIINLLLILTMNCQIPIGSMYVDPSIARSICSELPPTAHVEYLARQQGDHYLLVTRSQDNWDGKVVVHYGTSRALEQCTVSQFARLFEGGSTWIRFYIDSTEVEAFFGVHSDSTGISEGKAWCIIEADTVSIDRITPDQKILKELGVDCDCEITM